MSQPSHNRILIILILGALSTISPFAIDMYLPAFPGIAAALHTSLLLLCISFLVLAATYGLRRRVWAVWPTYGR